MWLLNVFDVELSTRAYHVLADLGVQSVSDLGRLSTEELLRRPNCGIKTAAEIERLARSLRARMDAAGLPEAAGKRVASSEGDFPIAWLLPVDAVPLSWRATRVLKALGCRLVGDLATMRLRLSVSPPGYGSRALREIRDLFRSYGAFLELDAEGWSGADPHALAKKYEGELQRVREEIIVRKFGRDLLVDSFMEDEVKVALSRCWGRRKVGRIVAWIGFSKDTDPTAGEVAEREFVSTNRIGQIVRSAEAKLRWYGLPTPALDRAMDTIERALPARDDRVEAVLREAELIHEGTRVRAVLRAARLFGADPKVRARRVGEQNFWIRSGDTTLELIRSEAKRAVERDGWARIREVARSVAERTGRDSLFTLTADFLAACDDFTWLDPTGGFFGFPIKRRNRVRHRLEKILAVAGRVDLSELRDGIARGGRRPIRALPIHVLRRLCEQLPDCAVVPDSNKVVDTGARNIERFLSVSEQQLFHLFKEFGPIMKRADIVSHATRRGLKRPSVEVLITESPILLRLDKGVYGLIGSTLDACLHG